MSRNESALGRAESWEVWMPTRAMLVGKRFPSELCPQDWARAHIPLAHRRQSWTTGSKAAACSSQASQGYLTTPSKPCLPSHCPRHHGRLTGGYSQAVASSKDGQLPHKDSGTKLAPCISPPCGHSY